MLLSGQSLPRLEDDRLLRGQGRFVDDLASADALHAVVLRAEHAHGDLLGVDAGAALAMPGCVAVHTVADLREDGIGPLPCESDPAVATGLVVPPRMALAEGRVRHVGEALALVLADTRAAALDAAAAVQVHIEPRPAVVSAAQALAAGAPQLWPQAPGNLAFHLHRGDATAVATAMREAAHLVSLELDHQRVSALPIEPRAGRAEYDAASGQFTLLSNAQSQHVIRAQLAGPVFGLPQSRFRLWAPDVGGGFGMKNFLYPEWVLLLWAARRHARPVVWQAQRSEELSGATHGRDIRGHACLALDAEGRFLALQASLLANLGACLSGSGPNVASRALPTAMGGVYAIPAVALEVRGVFTNTAPVDAYRGAGKPEANYLVERLVDAAARRLGLDPLALRRRNMVREFPHVSAFGTRIDGGRFASALERLETLADRAGFAARRAQSAARGRLRGLGFACFLETARAVPSEGAEVVFLDDGTVELRVGTESQGQGHATAFAQVAADRLGLPLQCFRLVQADTSRTRMGFGHGGARSMHMGGSALVGALQALLTRARTLAARLLQSEPAELRFADGVFSVSDSGRTVTLAAVAAAAREEPGGALQAFHRVDDAPFTLPNGCHAAEVEVDPETGQVRLLRYIAVDDYGVLINPRLTAGQVHGGLAQGIGQALMEHIVHDPDTAQLLSGSLLDYAIPRAEDLPDFELDLDGVATDANPLGVKGSGQAGAIAAPQTVVHAVLDALAAHGVEHIDMPLTPERVWRALQG